MPALQKEVSNVSSFVPACPADAVAHFSRLLSLETDCWDVHEAMEGEKPDFVPLDVRRPQSYAAGHVPGAVNLPHGRITARNLASHSEDTLFVVKMIGGIEGWKDEGFKLTENGTAENGHDGK